MSEGWGHLIVTKIHPVLQPSGCRVQAEGFRVQGSGFRVRGSGFRGEGSEDT